MPDETKTYQLIVRQMPAVGPELEELLQTLQGDFGLESYTARQRLLGQGLALFGKGPLEKTSPVAELVRRYGFACWIIETPKPTLAPDRLRSLELTPSYIDFTCQKTNVRLERGDRVVAVLADISGELSSRLLKRLVNQQTYRGHISVDRPELKETLHSIYQGEPVLDFYILSQDQTVRGGVRVSPGKFNHNGLGPRAGISAILNFDALRKVIEEYAGDYRLHTDFGLGHMPDCLLGSIAETTRRTKPRSHGQTVYGHSVPGPVKVEVEVKGKQTILGGNLKGLTRYGWLVMQLQGDGRSEPGPQGSTAGLTASVAAATVVGQPLLGAVLGQGEAADALPGLQDVAREVNAAINADAAPDAAGFVSPPQPRDLPSPPDRPETPTSPWRFLLIAGGVVAGLVLSLGSGGDEVLRVLTRYGLAAGMLPAMVAAAFFWGGLHFIRLKRHMENTPTSKVRSIAMGMVEVHGQARRIYALVAPMTHSACAWYRLRKYRKDKNGHWKQVREINSNHVPFQLEDATGRITVDPAGGTIKAKIQQTGYPGQSPLTFNAFGSSFGENEKWVEDIIYEGTSLYVLGYAQPLRAEKLGLRERTMAKLRQLKLDPQAMRRYDSNGDGQLDQEEWEAARSDAEQQALNDHLVESGERKRQEEHVIIAAPPQRSLPFLVAEASSEGSLTRRYGWISIPLLLGGVAATALAIYKFLQFAGV